MTRLIIVPDEIPKNPCEKCTLKTHSRICSLSCNALSKYEGRQSILSLPSISVEELDSIALLYLSRCANTRWSMQKQCPTFTEIILECLKAKEAGLK